MSANLDDLEAVLAVSRRRNFRAAAADLGVSRSALSHKIAAVESRIGVRLFHRTTRSVALTDAGAQLIESISPALGEIREAMAAAGARRPTPAGRLRINASVGAAQQMAAILADYARRYPDVDVEIVTDGALIDIVRAGFDAGVRTQDMVPRDMIAVPVRPEQRMAVVASPAYLAEMGEPTTPADLAGHHCIRGRFGDGPIWRWEFERGGERLAVDVDGSLVVDDTSVMIHAALAGIGLAYVSAWSVADYLAAGRLALVLDEWMPTIPPLCLYYPGRRLPPPGLRAMIDLAREWRAAASS